MFLPVAIALDIAEPTRSNQVLVDPQWTGAALAWFRELIVLVAPFVVTPGPSIGVVVIVGLGQGRPNEGQEYPQFGNHSCFCAYTCCDLSRNVNGQVNFNLRVFVDL